MKITPEAAIHLNKFKPRPYQLPIVDAIENKGYKRVIAIMPRRAGKDLTAFNLCIRQCIRKPCVIYYVFPTYAQGKKVIWDSVTNTGDRILDFIPDSLVDSKNSQEMKIRFKNGSLLQIVGSDNYDSLMGTNPQGVVFSEYALQDPRAYQYIRPILAANLGWALFISTPRGKNHLYELYQIALHSKNWFAMKLTLDDTQHISPAEIERERAEGVMSEDLIQQEYYTSFDMGVEGAYYAKYMDKMRLDGRIGDVPYEPGFKVYTAWDLGVRDSTTIIFFQTVGTTIRIVDCYENSKEGLDHYAKVLASKPYLYGKHIAPHDIAVRELGSGVTRIEKAKQLGIKFTIADNISIVDGIEAVRSTLNKVWIDQKCVPLIKALENYRQEYDVKNRVYKTQPLHNFASHFADAMRYLCVSLPKTRDGLSSEELDRRYQEAVMGSNAGLPSVFRDDLGRY
jgi:phage terminase large subunit